MNVSMRLFLILSVCGSSVLTQKLVDRGLPASSYNNLELHQSYRLVVSTAMNATTLVDSSADCAFACMRLPWCVSYNFGKTADKNGKHLCEALSVDKYNNSKDLLPNKEFQHLSIASPCSKAPCQNGGTCVPLYDKNDFKCVCSNPRKYKGRHCQVEVFPTTCKEASEIDNVAEDKAYSLLLDLEPVQVFCHITDISACGGGGWTLVMKMDGSKGTFGYNSAYWSNKNTYNPDGGATGLDNEETKLPTYWNTPFTKICLGMKVGSDTRFILLPQQASSLYSLIADGVYRATSLSRGTWKSLISGSSLQSNCNKGGFNVRENTAGARIGFVANNEHNCDSPDSVIGFGTLEHPHPETTCGNKASWRGDNGDKNIKANGYIFVQ